MERVTIKDVARRAGVSIATVSRVINKTSNVSPEIKKKIEEAIVELNYRPNLMARALKNDITHTIGIIISDISNPFFMNIIREVENQVKEFGYTLIMVSTDEDPEKERQYIKVMYDKRVDGIIISSTGKNEDYLCKVKDSGIPIIFIDRRPDDYKFDTVYVDKAKAAYNITNYLLSKGHRKIALISGPRDIITNYDRFLGYTKAFYNNNLPINNEFLYFGEYTSEYGAQVLEQIFKLKDKPTAIISASEKITNGILLQANRLNICIPDDISLVSFGDIEMGELIKPRLTYVDNLNNEVGKIAGKMILERLKDYQKNVEERILNTNLVIRESVKEIK
ncbi:MAG: LacI family transcriptional regulator [Clostridiales bacterium]|jgi:LacI family transcriptional regulator|nr:LacI family transcriptional regulator [Clostridiales bacterium]MDK2933744.1 LacI family transcriptional regulator [Clostridiales bacterium]